MIGTWTLTWKGWSYRKAHCGNMAHHHITGSHRVPQARFLDGSLPCDILWRVHGLFQQVYLLLGHQGLFNLSPRHQGLRTGQDKRRRICVGVARCRFRSSFSSATAQWPTIFHGHFSAFQQQLRQKAWNREEASPSSLSAPLSRMDLVAGDFNGAAWRQSHGNNPQATSILEEAFADTDFPMPPGPTPLWSPGAVPG